MQAIVSSLAAQIMHPVILCTWACKNAPIPLKLYALQRTSRFASHKPQLRECVAERWSILFRMRGFWTSDGACA